MQKKHVFLVSGRKMENGSPCGAVVNCVVCSEDERSVRLLLEQQEPEYWIVSVNSLLGMENRVKQIKGVLSGENTAWSLVVDPVLIAMAAA